MSIADPFSIVAKDLLEAAGLVGFGPQGVSAGVWPCFIGSEPDEPDSIVTIYDAAGPQPPNPKFLLEYPGLLLQTRSMDYAQGYQMAVKCRDVLLGLPSQTINGIRYDGIYCLVDTYFLKADEQGRSKFVSTWRAIREPSEGTNRQSL